MIYVNALTPAEAAAGMNNAHNNAVRLAKDAKTLLDAERYPSALALAILSIEESGKTSIIRSLVLARNGDDLKAAWREYRSHTSKNRLWPIIELAFKGARKLDDFSSLVANDAEHPFLLDQLKQIAFYTDCLGDRHWSMPDTVIDKKLATMIVRTAKLLSHGGEVSEREIELWAFHLGPVWMKSKEVMEKALVDWYASLQAEGLKPSGNNAMHKFIIEGLKDNAQ